MPRQQQTNIGVWGHDADSLDLSVIIPGLIRRRYTVLIPRTSSKDDVRSAAVDLAIYVRSQQPNWHVYVPGNIHTLAKNAARFTVTAVGDPVPRETHEWHHPPERTAEDRASALLRTLDPDLWSKMSGGKAFYFTTPEHRYIIYPNQRSLIALEDDEPKYVCIHSRDHAVEMNRFDWALTMRTYLLGDEEHLRETANFHTEYHMRGPIDAHRTRDDDAGGTHSEG